MIAPVLDSDAMIFDQSMYVLTASREIASLEQPSKAGSLVFQASGKLHPVSYLSVLLDTASHLLAQSALESGQHRTRRTACLPDDFLGSPSRMHLWRVNPLHRKRLALLGLSVEGMPPLC